MYFQQVFLIISEVHKGPYFVFVGMGDRICYNSSKILSEPRNRICFSSNIFARLKPCQVLLPTYQNFVERQFVCLNV